MGALILFQRGVNMVYIRREIEKDIKRWLDEREIIAMRGPRQSGKTTMLNRIRDILTGDGVGEECIHYINFEDDMTRLKFEEGCKEFIEFHLARGKEKNYFLLDEIQYVKEVGKKLKLVFDYFDNIKIIVTGSSSFDLTNIGKYLVGRIIFFDLLPFSFLEFLRSRGEKYERIYNKIRIDIRNKIKIRKTVFLDELSRFLHEYLTFGSYPRIVLEEDETKKKELLKNLFSTYVEKDIVSLYGNKYRDNTVRLLKTLSNMLGGMVNYETLAMNSGLKYNEVRKIIPLLQNSFVIFIVKPFYRNLTNELRKNPKIYFVDYGVRNYLTENFDNVAFDGLYENFVHNEFYGKHKIRYWRTTAKTEIDFILEDREIIPIEVKSTGKITRALRSFIGTYGPKKAFIANSKKTGKSRIGNCDVFMVPFVYL